MNTKDYHRGYIAAIKDLEEEVFDLDAALYLFAMDPADKDGNLPSRDYQEGYHDALLSIKRYGKPVYTSDNVTYVGFQCT